MFYLAAFPQFINATEAPGIAYILVATHSLINILWFSFLVLLIKRATHVTRSVRFKRWLNSITGFIFIGLGSKLALTSSH